MPIRFRCPSCDGVLSIGRRKAGSQVACPKCRADVTVPAPKPVAAAAASPEPVARPVPDDRPLFERDDFEKLLETPERMPALPKPEPKELEPERLVARPVAEDGLLISRGAVVALGVLMLVLLAMAFVTGYLIGR